MWKLPKQIEQLNQESIEQARMRHDQLTKPPGSLGMLEEIGIRLAGIQGATIPTAEPAAVVVMAGDHGVTEEGVSAFPSEVTVQMVLNFMAGGAAINVLARNAGADVHVVDIGVKADIPLEQVQAGNSGNRLWIEKVRYGTGNMAKEPAMTRDEAEQALSVGWKIGRELSVQGYKVIALGEMGIGNTTASAAIASVLTGKPVPEVVGAGTGLSTEGIRHKSEVIERAIATNAPDPQDPVDVLAKVGGLEIAGLTGLTLACAAHRVAVVVDGFIASAAAIAAVRIEPAVQPYLFASHKSVEPGHRILLEALDLQPLFDFSMRLGEGSGASLALPVLQGAARVLKEMATFAEAGVSDGVS
ncbi:nicotinate-nucleotide--dimethylbenzimidazole phosphoribosyltransferase [Effusibacillus lacus]|uniref:Nicotinate-nucleotide--dimethylbenzimidazole phosphoribosyltransferase n=1 Tax=Effusibacillus lacus TaxID=1348429 RepID=A0A292YLV3_9BACL|nr:nicotinate-nucleotide--dimethylbenzimidazole phosphoribosyltransferase [Effusibacillus lacus]TCS70839.1 nicotinate-nucleotide-dimethylbenzimidazole phosphoribosyltransferase [Effusibacillus lacus]GAX89364.1 nicotinate-nucleotide--dimethylbenzimidazole phosphoribosyltransferase [Effusibacillus lacus]